MVPLKGQKPLAKNPDLGMRNSTAKSLLNKHPISQSILYYRR